MELDPRAVLHIHREVDPSPKTDRGRYLVCDACNILKWEAIYILLPGLLSPTISRFENPEILPNTYSGPLVGGPDVIS